MTPKCNESEIYGVLYGVLSTLGYFTVSAARCCKCFFPGVIFEGVVHKSKSRHTIFSGKSEAGIVYHGRKGIFGQGLQKIAYIFILLKVSAYIYTLKHFVYCICVQNE